METPGGRGACTWRRQSPSRGPESDSRQAEGRATRSDRDRVHGESVSSPDCDKPQIGSSPPLRADQRNPCLDQEGHYRNGCPISRDDNQSDRTTSVSINNSPGGAERTSFDRLKPSLNDKLTARQVPRQRGCSAHWLDVSLSDGSPFIGRADPKADSARLGNGSDPLRTASPGVDSPARSIEEDEHGRRPLQPRGSIEGTLTRGRSGPEQASDGGDLAPGVSLTRAERHGLRGLVSPPFPPAHCPDTQPVSWEESDGGNRMRSRSDVRHDALPLLQNGEIDYRSVRSAGEPAPFSPEAGLLTDEIAAQSRIDQQSLLRGDDLLLPSLLLPLLLPGYLGGEICSSPGETPPAARRQERPRSSTHPYPRGSSGHLEGRSTDSGQQGLESPNQERPDGRLHSPDGCPPYHQLLHQHHQYQHNHQQQHHHRRNAIGDVMDTLPDRVSRAPAAAAAAAATDDGAGGGLCRLRLRRDVCALGAEKALRLRSNSKDQQVPPTISFRRRRTYADLNGSLTDKTAVKIATASQGRRMSVTSHQLLIRAQLARQRFSHAIRMIIILLRIHTMIFNKRKHDSNKVAMTFTEIADRFHSNDMKSSGLSFDPRDFKAKREINISSEAKNILNMPSFCRTPEQLQTALYGLQTMKSFAEYPLHMQEKLVKVAWFESIPPKRVIIRQGHYAENFYFVISGSVVVTIMESRPDTGETHIRTAAVLRKGSSFGELALLHHSKRTATVASQGEVQLLAIGREDFFDIFMRGHQPGEEPDHVKYLRQINFMKYWPLERLVEHPEMCLFHFYKRGQVVVKDSNKSDWIYIVKSGSCQVLRQLNAVKPAANTDQSRPVRLPRLHARHLSAPELSAKRQARTRVRNHSATSSYLQFISVPTMTVANASAPMETDGQSSGSDTSESFRVPSTTFLTRQRTMADFRGAPSESSLSQASSGAGSEEPVLTSLPTISGHRRLTYSRESYSRSKYREFASRNPPPPAPERTPVTAPQVVVSDEHSGSDSSSSTDTRTSVFVQLELLLPKDVFGLSTLSVDLGIDHEQSSVNLVSRGAECIMIQKDFFAKYCTEETRSHIRSLIKPYPPPELLQHNLQNHSNWTNYKHEEVASVLRDKSKAKGLRL